MRWMRLGVVAVGTILFAAAVYARADVAGDDALAIVVSPAGERRTLTMDDLAAIYRRKKQYWSDGSRIEPVNLPVSASHRVQFSRWVLGLTPEEMEAYWDEMYFHGILPPHVVASVEAVLRFVADTPGAVGYVPPCSADKRVVVAFIIDASGRTNESAAAACRR
jgi:ABC-type phosphate transport system substrate-binding protein